MPADELDAAVRGYCDALVRGAPGALAGDEGAAAPTGPPSCAPSWPGCPRVSTGYFLSAEGREGVAAFREKRDRRAGCPLSTS